MCVYLFVSWSFCARPMLEMSGNVIDWCSLLRVCDRSKCQRHQTRLPHRWTRLTPWPSDFCRSCPRWTAAATVGYSVGQRRYEMIVIGVRPNCLHANQYTVENETNEFIVSLSRLDLFQWNCHARDNRKRISRIFETIEQIDTFWLDLVKIFSTIIIQ